MKNKLLVLLFALTLSFFSCDIPGRIIIVNKTNEDAYCEIVQQNSVDQIDTLRLAVSNIKGENREGILFHYGEIWTNDRIIEYADSIVSLEITSDNQKMLLTEKSEIMLFLKKRRKGIFNQTIRIVVD